MDEREEGARGGANGDEGGNDPSSRSVPEILRAADARTVLARLLEDDRLEIRSRCQARLRDQAMLVSIDRLYLRSAARIAHAASAYRGEPALDVWLGRMISISIRELLEEEREWIRAGSGGETEQVGLFAPLAAALGMEPGLLRRGCVAFNAQSYDVRRAFWALVIENVPLERFVEEEGCSRAQALRRLQRATRAIGVNPERPLGGMEGGEHGT